MFHGKTSAALHLLSQSDFRGVLHVGDLANLDDPDSQSVLDVLKSKHLQAQPASPVAVPWSFVEVQQIHPVVFEQINASSIRSAALHTRGAAGPLGIDAHCWRSLCTFFKSTSDDIRHSLALLARRLCTSFVDPRAFFSLLTCCLIALDECPGVRPIGICETARRIISNAVLSVVKYDIQDAT